MESDKGKEEVNVTDVTSCELRGLSCDSERTRSSAQAPSSLGCAAERGTSLRGANSTNQSNVIIQIGEELDEIADHQDVEFKVPETPLFLAQTQSSEPQIDLNRLFQHPNFETDDQNSESDSLTPEMLSSIRKTARFVVPR